MRFKLLLSETHYTYLIAWFEEFFNQILFVDCAQYVSNHFISAGEVRLADIVPLPIAFFGITPTTFNSWGTL